MQDETIEIKRALRNLTEALLTDGELEWDNAICSDDLSQDPSEEIRLRIYGGIVTTHNSYDDAIGFLVASYDSGRIKITIDTSKNHGRAHIHIGIKQDKYHSASIALDNGEVMSNTGNIDQWKINKIINWVNTNQAILKKIWRCVNTWGDAKSAERRKNRLSDI